MKFRPVYLLAAIPLMIGAAMPFAIAGPDKFGEGSGDRSERMEKFWESRRQRMIEDLGLTDAQVEQLEAFRPSKEDMKDNFDAIKTEMETMRSLVAGSATPQALRTQHNKIQDLHQSMSRERFEKMLQMYEVLTPEQRAKFAEKMKFGHHGRRGFRGMGAKQPEQISFLTF